MHSTEIASKPHMCVSLGGGGGGGGCTLSHVSVLPYPLLNGDFNSGYFAKLINRDIFFLL